MLVFAQPRHSNALVRIEYTVCCTSNALVRIEYTVSCTSNALVRIEYTVCYTSNALVRRSTLSHVQMTQLLCV